MCGTKKVLTVLISAIMAASVSAEAPLFQELSPTSIVARVEGESLTKADVLRNAKAGMTLVMNKQRATTVGRREKKLFIRNCQQALSHRLNAAAVERYARENNVTVSSNILADCATEFRQRYGVFSKKLKRWHTIDDLKYMLGRNADYVDRAILEHARHIAVTNAIAISHPVVVSEDQVNERLASIALANATASATNALVYAHATNVWEQIKSGEVSFEVAATNNSQDVNLGDGIEWGTFTLDQIADDGKLLALVMTLEPGAITPPIESDNGLAIIRVDEVSEDRKTYTFSRIFFMLPMFFEEETFEEARAQVKSEQEAALIRKTLECVREGLKVEYPSGSPLFAKDADPLVLKAEDFNQ